MKKFIALCFIALFFVTGCGNIKKNLPLGRYDYQSPVHGDLAIMIGQTASIKAVDAEYEALITPIGRKVYWSHDNGKYKGFVVSLRESTKGEGLICREFQHVITSFEPEKKLFSGKCMKEGNWK
ncbi:MAG: hypothetical protein CMP22_04405 [Rickettsiales bacterium]|nr:hypothetical protein [Rickettsiales bacterium]